MAFKEDDILSPPKTIHNYQSGESTEENTFLFMPAWDNKTYYGCKLITATPSNRKTALPYINGIYLLFDASSGIPLIGMNARLITNYRTAATSALAASKLMRKSASELLILGNGALSPFYIEAHMAVQPYEKIYLWGRNMEKSKSVVKEVGDINAVDIVAVEHYRALLKTVDVISCITSSKEPLISQADLGKSQHLDLAGSFTPEMHEVSTDVISSSHVYTDNLDTTPYHAGEIVSAIQSGFFEMEKIQDNLSGLCKMHRPPSTPPSINTLFKSTGMAIEDLVIAQLLYRLYIEARTA